MTETTPLDQAHAAMEAAPEDDAARLRFFERLADSELFILLDKEPEGDRIAGRQVEKVVPRGAGAPEHLSAVDRVYGDGPVLQRHHYVERREGRRGNRNVEPSSAPQAAVRD